MRDGRCEQMAQVQKDLVSETDSSGRRETTRVGLVCAPTTYSGMSSISPTGHASAIKVATLIPARDIQVGAFV